MIVFCTVYAGHLAWVEREDSLPRLKIRALASGEEHAIDFDEEAYALHLEPGLEFDTTTLRFTYSSMTTPHETYDYDMVSRTRVLVKREEIPSGHDPKNYVTRRLFAQARGWRERADHLAVSLGFQAWRRSAAAALWLWRLRPCSVGEFRLERAVAGRSRPRLRLCACAGRHGQGLELVRERQARAQDQQLHRLHRLRAASDRRGLHARGGDRRARAPAPEAC